MACSNILNSFWNIYDRRSLHLGFTFYNSKKASQAFLDLLWLFWLLLSIVASLSLSLSCYESPIFSNDGLIFFAVLAKFLRQFLIAMVLRCWSWLEIRFCCLQDLLYDANGRNGNGWQDKHLIIDLFFGNCRRILNLSPVILQILFLEGHEWGENEHWKQSYSLNRPQQRRKHVWGQTSHKAVWYVLSSSNAGVIVSLLHIVTEVHQWSCKNAHFSCPFS